MSSKHTPGPWQVGPNAMGEMLSIWSRHYCIVSLFSPNFGDDVPPAEQNAANACLIAAAPEMLEALLEFAWAIHGGGSVAALTVALDQAKAAINKATGAA